MVFAATRLNAVVVTAGRITMRLLDACMSWQERSRQRRDLMRLDDRMLRDIGVDRSQAEAEYRKAPWHG